jgi:hypothetical protein
MQYLNKILSITEVTAWYSIGKIAAYAVNRESNTWNAFTAFLHVIAFIAVAVGFIWIGVARGTVLGNKIA